MPIHNPKDGGSNLVTDVRFWLQIKLYNNNNNNNNNNAVGRSFDTRYYCRNESNFDKSV